MKSDEELKEILKSIISKIPLECQACRSKAAFITNTNQMLKCTWQHCQKSFSLYKNTVFWCSKMDKLKILRILDCWLNEMPIEYISFITGISAGRIGRFLKRVEAKYRSEYFKDRSSGNGVDMLYEVEEPMFESMEYRQIYR